MAKKKKTQQQQQDQTSSDNASVPPEEETFEEGEVELTQVDLGDTVKMKQVLDEATAAAILENVQEEYRWDNIKLTLMFIACVFAMIAQFVRIPFPESRPVLGFCGCAYFMFSGILQFIMTFIDKDSILLTRRVKKCSTNKDMENYGLNIRSSLPRFSEWYTVCVEFSTPDDVSGKSCEQTWSVGQFFDKDGYFDEAGVMEEVNKLFHRFETKQYDGGKNNKKKVS